MFKTASLNNKKALLVSCSILAIMQPVSSFAQETQPNQEAEVDDSTVIYGAEFISQQQGMVTAIDLINRIPGGSAFLGNGNGNGGGSQRGFSSNDDPILINGQRISGKSNSSRQALSQIPVSQVLRVEIIRGSSPDIKVSSQGALLNVVMIEDAGGSGSWQARLNYMVGKTSGEVKGSYSDKISFVDYTVSLQLENFKNDVTTNEMLYDASDLAIFQLDEQSDRNFRKARIASNATLHLNNGNELNINGLFQINSFSDQRTGDYLSPDAFDELTVAGQSQFNFDNERTAWEIGMDYDTKIAPNWEAKFIALHSQASRDTLDGEDFDIIDGNIIQDYTFSQDVFTSENIGRAALVWTPLADHRLEFATELSFNKRRSHNQLFELVDGVLVETTLDAGDVTIKETRDESSIIHSWQMNEKISLDTAFTYEYSKISQSGNIEKQRTFNYLKPSWDLRYNLSPKNQFQFSVRKQVSQLNFGHFASSYSNDNEIVGGNSELRPQESWLFEASYEHRLDDDLGFIKPKIYYEKFSSKLTQVEVGDGISGVGNTDDAKEYGLELEGAIRFYFIGLPNLKLSGDFRVRFSELEDQFTGEKIPFNYSITTPTTSLKLRHDFPEQAFFWEVDVTIDKAQEYRDIDEKVNFADAGKFWVNVAAEKQIFDGIVLRLSYDNIFNPTTERNRYYYEDGRAGGVLTTSQDRFEKYNRKLFITLKGTF